MKRSLFALAALLSAALPAAAGTITSATVFGPGPNQGFGPGLGFLQVALISTPNVDNDNQTGGGAADNDIVIPFKRFDFPGYIDLEFLVADSGGVTEYKVDETIDNNTGLSWSHFRMELGYGVGADFVRSTGADALDFDAPEYLAAPTSAAFGTVTLAPDVLVFTNGVHGTGFQNYQFRIDVPNVTGGKFTLRQIPIVPEPGTWALVAVGITGLLAPRIFRSLFR